MMFSRIFGRGSIYETLDLDGQHRDPGYDQYGSALSHDDALHSEGDARNSSFMLQNRTGATSRASRHHITANSLYRHYESTLPNLNEEEPNDEVPRSLLVEDQRSRENGDRQAFYESFDPTQEEVMDNMERGISPPNRGGSRTPDPTVWLGLVDPKERAMWKWANVENLDVFLQQVPSKSFFVANYQKVYDYYIGKGIYCIMLARFLNLAYFRAAIDHLC